MTSVIWLGFDGGAIESPSTLVLILPCFREVRKLEVSTNHIKSLTPDLRKLLASVSNIPASYYLRINTS